MTQSHIATAIAPSSRPRNPLELIRTQQQRSWDRFSPGWSKWDTFTLGFLAAQGEAIVRALDPAPSAHVLDVATGTGEPGLTLAARVPDGAVTGVDVSEGMMNVAARKALEQGVQNYRTQVGDASALPFASASFDAISSRLGFMFFPNMDLAAGEMHRVLRPGGVVAATVWAQPEHNLWITALVGAIKKHLEMPTPPPGAPGMFRVARPGHLAEIFERAGFSVVADEPIRGVMRARSFEEYWEFMNDVVPPVVAVLDGVGSETIAAIKAETKRTLDARIPGDAKDIEVGAYLVTARKA